MKWVQEVDVFKVSNDGLHPQFFMIQAHAKRLKYFILSKSKRMVYVLRLVFFLFFYISITKLKLLHLGSQSPKEWLTFTVSKSKRVDQFHSFFFFFTFRGQNEKLLHLTLLVKVKRLVCRIVFFFFFYISRAKTEFTIIAGQNPKRNQFGTVARRHRAFCTFYVL